MSTVIRLARGGRKKLPFYHVVVADKRKARNGRFIEQLGHFDPLAEGKGKWVVNTERVAHWLSVGAEPSDRMISFLMANDLGSDRQRKKWTTEIERRKALYTKRKQDADAVKAAETKAAADEAAAEAKAAAEAAAAAPAEEAAAETTEAPAAEATEETKAE